MFSANVKRIVVAVLLVSALALAVPGRAQADNIGLSSSGLPGVGLWVKALDFLHHFFAGSSAPQDERHAKYGPAQTSDGVTKPAAVQAN